MKKLRTYLGRVIRDIARKIEGRTDSLGELVLGRILALARRVLDQKPHQRGPKVYSLHAPEVHRQGQGVLGGLAEFERELIRSRTGEGRQRAKAFGTLHGAQQALRHVLILPKNILRTGTETLLKLLDGDLRFLSIERERLFPPAVRKRRIDHELQRDDAGLVGAANHDLAVFGIPLRPEARGRDE